jgi:hypothetical protein
MTPLALPRPGKIALALLASLVTLASLPSLALADWRLETITTAAPVEGIETIGGDVLIVTRKGWLRAVVSGDQIGLAPAKAPRFAPIPAKGLPDDRIASGANDVARAWLADPTQRYRHGVLGDAVEAASVVIERRGGRTETVPSGRNAVFEDLEPRIVDLDGDGKDEVLVVKSYLKTGSALAVIGTHDGKATIVAETPAIGTPHRWLNPAGIADFDGDGATDIALVMMPHAVGRLELWTWRNGLSKTRAFGNTSNHFIGSLAQHMSAVADFDGNGIADLAIPSFDRRHLRLIAFKDKPHDIAKIALPARAATNVGLLRIGETPALLVGLDNGTLALVRK